MNRSANKILPIIAISFFFSNCNNSSFSDNFNKVYKDEYNEYIPEYDVKRMKGEFAPIIEEIEKIEKDKEVNSYETTTSFAAKLSFFFKNAYNKIFNEFKFTSLIDTKEEVYKKFKIKISYQIGGLFREVKNSINIICKNKFRKKKFMNSLTIPLSTYFSRMKESSTYKFDDKEIEHILRVITHNMVDKKFKNF